MQLVRIERREGKAVSVDVWSLSAAWSVHVHYQSMHLYTLDTHSQRKRPSEKYHSLRDIILSYESS